MDATFEATDFHPTEIMYDWMVTSDKPIHYTLIDPSVQKLLNDKSQKFDLIIIDLLWNEALLGQYSNR
jgi:hypothetical protein